MSLVVVTRLRAGSLSKRGSIPGRGNCFPYAANIQNRLWGSNNFTFNKNRASLLVVGGGAKKGAGENQKYYLNRCKHWLYINYQLVDYYLFIKYYSPLTQAVYRQATRNSHREWQYHMLHVYNCILLKMSTWCSKHVEEYNILWINNNFKECHPRCVGELDRWEGSQKHNSYLI